MSAMLIEPSAGRLVVATPTLADPNFSHTVVLLLEHGDEGTLGVIVNRPSDVGVDDVLEEWSSLAAAPARVFIGGPVQANALLAIGRLGPTSSASVQPVGAGLGVVDLHQHAADLSGAVTDIRVFAGHAGWGPSQLESEIETGSWFVLNAAPDDAFAADPESLWHAVLERQGGWFRTIPDDPSLN